MYIIKKNKKSIKYQTIIFKINTGEDIKNVGPHTKVHITFAQIDSMNSIDWNHEVCSCLGKSRKSVENQIKL